MAGQIALLIERENFARESNDPKKIVMTLAATVQRSNWEDGSSLGIIMGLVRSNVTANIRAALREKTGVDYGEDLGKWRTHFGPNP